MRMTDDYLSAIIQVKRQQSDMSEHQDPKSHFMHVQNKTKQKREYIHVYPLPKLKNSLYQQLWTDWKLVI